MNRKTMHIASSDQNISNIRDCINEGIYDLKPDFQRDLVWPKLKQQKLIDSIMRGWHIPPIHLVKIGDKRVFEVLDGKQRLYSIYNFVNDEFPFKGDFLPGLQDFSLIENKKYSDFPENIKRDFDFKRIRILEVSDVKMYEATELFLRLNQGVTVSDSEKRNCIYGNVKEFLREVLSESERLFSEKSLGFPNRRMAYQDVIDRLLFLELENGLTKKPTSSALEGMYYKEHIEDKIKLRLVDNLRITENVLADFSDHFGYKLTKSTLMSYYWFLREINIKSEKDIETARNFIVYFERWRESQKSEYETDKNVNTKYIEFSTYLSKGWLDPASLQGRNDIIIEFFEKYLREKW